MRLPTIRRVPLEIFSARDALNVTRPVFGAFQRNVPPGPAVSVPFAPVNVRTPTTFATPPTLPAASYASTSSAYPAVRGFGRAKT